MSDGRPFKQSGARYSVAVYWFSAASYGGTNAAKDWSDAMKQVEKLRQLGYEEPGISEIHVFRRVTDIWRASELTDCRAKLAAGEQGKGGEK